MYRMNNNVVSDIGFEALAANLGVLGSSCLFDETLSLDFPAVQIR